jgi:hypothetical protein
LARRRDRRLPITLVSPVPAISPRHAEAKFLQKSMVRFRFDKEFWGTCDHSRGSVNGSRVSFCSNREHGSLIAAAASDQVIGDAAPHHLHFFPKGHWYRQTLGCVCHGFGAGNDLPWRSDLCSRSTGRGIRRECPGTFRVGSREGGVPNGRPDSDGQDRHDNDPIAANDAEEYGSGRSLERSAHPGPSRAWPGACDGGASKALEADAPCRQTACIAQGLATRTGMDALDLPGARRGGLMKLDFLALPESERQLYIEQATARRSLSPVILEKDFWVCWLLGILFESEFADSLVFKGGTSLSKFSALSSDSRTTSTSRCRLRSSSCRKPGRAATRPTNGWPRLRQHEARLWRSKSHPHWKHTWLEFSANAVSRGSSTLPNRYASTIFLPCLPIRRSKSIHDRGCTVHILRGQTRYSQAIAYRE